MRVLTCLALFLLSLAAWADGVSVRVAGLFPDRALIVVDGQQYFLKLNESTPQGIKLIAANTEKAVIEINGKRETMTVSSDIRVDSAPAEVRRVHIARNSNGMYFTTGAINGIPVTMLVDTGATSIAMSSKIAEKFGIAFRHSGKPMTVSTANGTARAWQVVLKSVRVGEIERFNVKAAVIEGPATQEVLLGMSFLSTVKLKEEQNMLTLEAIY